MFVLSLTTLRDRWTLFVGAVATVTIGVALVQASLLTLIAAATPDIPDNLSPAEDFLVRDGYSAAVALMGMVLFIAAFVAIFVVGSTFAFTVAQRRRVSLLSHWLVPASEVERRWPVHSWGVL